MFKFNLRSQVAKEDLKEKEACVGTAGTGGTWNQSLKFSSSLGQIVTSESLLPTSTSFTCGRYGIRRYSRQKFGPMMRNFGVAVEVITRRLLISGNRKAEVRNTLI
jgi:hypothetical protein